MKSQYYNVHFHQRSSLCVLLQSKNEAFLYHLAHLWLLFTITIYFFEFLLFDFQVQVLTVYGNEMNHKRHIAAIKATTHAAPGHLNAHKR